MANLTDDSEHLAVTILPDWTDGEGASFHLVQAWLPMVLLDGVTVTVETYEGMSVMERFVTESLLTLGKLDASDLQEIASIPVELGAWLLGCLKQRGLAKELELGTFKPIASKCSTAMEEGRLPVRRPQRLDILWFPETEEAVVMEEAAPLSRQLRNIRPGKSFPLSDGVRGRSRREVLLKLLRANRLYGRDGVSIFDVDDEKAVGQSHCPAYACGAVLPFAEDGNWRLVVSVLHRRKRPSAGPKEGGASHADAERIELPVPRLKNMVTKYRSELATVTEFIANKLATAHGIQLTCHDGLPLRAEITEDGAAELRQTCLLRELSGLKVRVSDEFELAMPLKLKPSDQGAEELFAVDKAVTVYLGDEAKVLPPELERGTLCERLWELRLYKPLYDLREPVDFAP